jgi:hypothetical protein
MYNSTPQKNPNLAGRRRLGRLTNSKTQLKKKEKKKEKEKELTVGAHAI